MNLAAVLLLAFSFVMAGCISPTEPEATDATSSVSDEPEVVAWTPAPPQDEAGSGVVVVNITAFRSGDRVRVEATATNVGDVEVEIQIPPLACRAGIEIAYADPDADEGPRGGASACQGEAEPLRLGPNETITASDEFTGTLRDHFGNARQAKSGNWTAIARVTWNHVDASEGERVQRTAAFEWSGGPGSAQRS